MADLARSDPAGPPSGPAAFWGASVFTHHIPDDGARYAPGETVRIDHASGRVEIIKDLAGAYEVMSCRPATEYGGDPPLLRVGLRKREATPIADPELWTPGRPSR